MFKKIGLFLKFLIGGVVWSTLWCVITQQIVFKIWNFDYLSPNQWRVIKAFWEKNGVIRGVSDYMLFLTLIVILVVWYFGFKKLYRVQYGKFLLKPFESFSKRQITKYENESKHVVIKNLVVGEKMSLEDFLDGSLTFSACLSFCFFSRIFSMINFVMMFLMSEKILLNVH